MQDSLGFESRFASAVVRSIETNFINVDLEQPLLGLDKARIYRQHWCTDRQWARGDRLARIFIYNVSADAKEGKGQGHWFASELWGENENNPWHHSHKHHPVAGQDVSGEVIRYAGEWVIVRLDESQLEAFLHLHEVPDWRSKPMVELLPLGLRLRAKIISVNGLRCKLDISVQAWISGMKQNQQHSPAVGWESTTTPYLRFVDALDMQANAHSEAQNQRQIARQSPKPSSLVGKNELAWQGKGVLVLDDDKIFCRSICAWLEQFGAQAWAADNPAHAKQILAQHKVSHIMLDYSLGSRQLQSEFLNLIKPLKHRLPICVISGQPELAAPYAERLGMGFLAKPVHFSDANHWLLEGKAPKFDAKAYQAAAFWENTLPGVSVDIAARANHWLAALCRQTKAVAACWVRCLQPGYALQAEHGMGFAMYPHWREKFLMHLNQTLVTNVEFNATAAKMEKREVLPLREFWPSPATHVWVSPLYEQGQNSAQRVVDDVLIVFSVHGFELLEIENPIKQELTAWWQDLLSLERAQHRIQEEAVFATQGRVHSATLHELRPLVQAFESNRAWQAEEALNWWPKGQKVKRLVDSGLYNIKPERAAEIHLRDRLMSLMETFVWGFANRRRVTTVVYLPPKNLTVCLPPEVFEQGLINLIDNATKFCERRHWAKVEISVFVDTDPSKQKCPLVLQVSDQGGGMTPEQIRYLFQPRHSGDIKGGFGMGMYISASLARAVGGELHLHSNFRWGGCVFQLRLPLIWGGVQKVESQA